MPVYYYQCTSSDCSDVYTKTELMSDHNTDENVICSKCQSLMNQVVYPSLMNFKGTGWSNDSHGKEIVWKQLDKYNRKGYNLIMEKTLYEKHRELQHSLYSLAMRVIASLDVRDMSDSDKLSLLMYILKDSDYDN